MGTRSGSCRQRSKSASKASRNFKERYGTFSVSVALFTYPPHSRTTPAQSAALGKHLWAHMVFRMARCSDSFYVSGEKVSRHLYSVVIEKAGSIEFVTHAEQAPDTLTPVWVIPSGLLSDEVLQSRTAFQEMLKLFEASVWRGSVEKKLAKGSKGKNAARNWDQADAIAVAVCRAHGIFIKAPGAEAARSTILRVLENNTAPERLARACSPSSDARLSSLALAYTPLSKRRVELLSKSPLPHLRATAATLSKDPKTLSMLAKDSSAAVLQAVARNAHTPSRVLESFASDPSLRYELAGNAATNRETLLDIVALGGFDAQVAVSNANIADQAERVLRLRAHTPTKVFAARNAGIDPTTALVAARESIEVATALATNAGVVSRMSSDEALQFLDILAKTHSFDDMAAVCRFAAFSKDAQLSLLEWSPTTAYKALGLAGNAHLSATAAELVLDVAGRTEVLSGDFSAEMLQALAANKASSQSTLSAIDSSSPGVALALRANDNATSHLRRQASLAIQEFERQAVSEIEKSLESKELAPQPGTYRFVADSHALKSAENNLAYLSLEDCTEGRSHFVSKDWGLASWGASRLEFVSNPASWGDSTTVLVRMDPQAMKKAADSNPTVDPLGVCIEQSGVRFFALLEPSYSMVPNAVTQTDVATALPGSFAEPSVLERAVMFASKLDRKALAYQGLLKIPGLAPAVKAAKLAAQTERFLSRAPGKFDRAATVPTSLHQGGTLRVLSAECSLAQAPSRSQEFALSLHKTGNLSEHDLNAVTSGVEQLYLKAAKQKSRHALPYHYAQMLRFRAGQVEVFEHILNHTEPWL